MFRKYFFYLAIIGLFLSSCHRADYYVFPMKRFGMKIPTTIPALYNLDTVECGRGCIKKTMVLKLTASEFQQYFGHLAFRDIDPVNIKYDSLNHFTHMDIEMVVVDSISKKTKVYGYLSPNKYTLHYDFKFKNGKMFFVDNDYNKLILYDPKEEVLIFYSFI